MATICCSDPRRGAVRRFKGRNGLDYVEVGDDQRTLHVYFLGKLPAQLREDGPGLETCLRIEGGERITGIRILDADPLIATEPDRDDALVLKLDRAGDHSRYRLRLVGIDDIDPHYAAVDFSFKIGCPSDLDCKPLGACPTNAPEAPEINYLAKDYASFRQLIFDRLAVLMPQWRERHAPDLGVTLVELLAHAGDELSYYQDAVATEAYLDTARQRLSVRRHARLVDYRLHEGCNARVWISVEVTQDLVLKTAEFCFITGLNDALPLQQTVLDAAQLADLPEARYEVFEPMTTDEEIRLRSAHNRIRFYDWGRRDCCLPRGSTRATLVDTWTGIGGDARALQLAAGDVLIFEEVRGARSGLVADADPTRRHVVRLTRVTAVEDPVYAVQVNVGAGELAQSKQRPQPLLEIEWAPEDALPFALCLSALGSAPECAWLGDISIARGNVIAADHGRSVDEALPEVPAAAVSGACVCEGQSAEIQPRAARYRPVLAQAPLVHRDDSWREATAAAQLPRQDVRRATPQLLLRDSDDARWQARADLLASSAEDRDLVAEIDNDGRAHLRFGDGVLGAAPRAGLGFAARYRVGGGVAGNVGAESISRLVLRNGSLSGIGVSVRNPLPASGGTEPEPLAEAKLYAPRAFRKQLERAVTAGDYARLAERHPAVQRANAELVWTGSWYEADVAIDPLGQTQAGPALLAAVETGLYPYRRMGHDLHVEPASYVPIDLALEVCALPGYERGHVHAALLDRFRQFFDPDRLSFGQSIQLSRLVAEAQQVAGVECARVRRLQRLFETDNHEIDNGVLELGSGEIPQLGFNANFPERGKLEIVVRGGR